MRGYAGCEGCRCSGLRGCGAAAASGAGKVARADTGSGAWAEEVISYGQPTFMLHGHLVAFGAFKKHLSFFPMSSTLIAKYPEAAPFATSSGTLQFQPEEPIPAALVTKLVKARIAQNLEVAGWRAAEEARAAKKPRQSPQRQGDD